MAPNMLAELVRTASQMAIAQRQPPPGLLVHSDRGSQYASAAPSTLLARHHFAGQHEPKGHLLGQRRHGAPGKSDRLLEPCAAICHIPHRNITP